MASISGVINAINKLSKPLQKKIAKKLGIDVEGKPGRKSDSIIVGTDRVAAEKKINKLIGGGIGAGGTIAALSVGDIINDLLGIKKMGDATLTEADKRKAMIGKAQAETTTTKKKTSPKLTKDDMPKLKPKDLIKKKKMFMKEGKTGKDSEVEFKAMSEGGLGKGSKIDSMSRPELLKTYGPQITREFGKGELDLIKREGSGQGGIDRMRKMIKDLVLNKGGYIKPKKLAPGGALKKIPDTNPGLKALKKQAPDVVKKMGYMRVGGMMKKKKTGNTDYRKGGAVGMMITISDNMKKKGK
tara:strand:- start:329 stop:1225 length:897 start_codon:yes stop_codon:yes gene_type:complete